MPYIDIALRPHISNELLNSVFWTSREIIAVVLNCDEGQVRPADLEYNPNRVSNAAYLTADVVIRITAWPYDERFNKERKSAQVTEFMESFNLVGNDRLLTYSVGFELTLHDYASSNPDDLVEPMDMTLDAAHARALTSLNEHYSKIGS